MGIVYEISVDHTNLRT